MKYILALLALMGSFTFAFAQSKCPIVTGETPLGTFYKDGGNNTPSEFCKAVLTNGKCLRVPPSNICPGGTITELNDNQSAIVYKQYLYDKTRK